MATGLRWGWLSRVERRASIAWAPDLDQRILKCFGRRWTAYLQADSTAPLPMG